MTLIVAIPASDGLVMASDGQVTAGPFRWQDEEKIKKLNDSCLWAGVGELALIQRVEESVANLSKEEPLQKLRDELAKQVRESVVSLLNLDFRSQFFKGSPNDLLGLHPGSFIFAEYRGDSRILHVTSHGTPEWITKSRIFALGSGEPFAYALLQKYQGANLGVRGASVLAFKVIEEAIEVGAYGLGPPITVYQIGNAGTTKLPEAEIAALKDTSQALRDAEVEVFVRDLQTE